MRKLIGILIVFALAISVMNVFAVRPSTPNKPATPTEEKLSKREQFRAKLMEIKNEEKRALAERLQQRIDEINLRLCENYENYLKKIEMILDKMEDIVAELKTKGIKTENVEKMIQQARDKIAELRAKVNQQKEKDYTVNITGEKFLKVNFGSTMSQLRKDHRNLRTEIKSLRKLVGQILIELRKLSPSPVPTPSLVPTPLPATPSTPTQP